MAPAQSRSFALIDAFPFAIGVHRDLRFLYVNRAAASFLGYDDAAELVGRPIMAICHPSELPVVGARVAHMMRTGEALPERETRLVKRDGGIVMADLAAFAITDADGLPSYVVVARDISERKAIEERLRLVQRMEAVGRLAGGIAHDFNNLLAVIMSSAELLSHSLAQDGPDAEHALAILAAAERASLLTQQLLTFSRGQVSEPEPIRPNEIVLGLEGFLRRSFGQGAGVTLVTSLQANLPRIRASASQLEQVLVNLVINARDALPKGGEITLRSGLETVPEASLAGSPPDDDPNAGRLRPGAYVKLEVIDNGEGMSPETASRAFEPFFTTKAPGHGTGLGLSTVYGIVSQAGGRCEITSAPGRGTIVKILWPAAEEVTPALRDAELRAVTDRPEPPPKLDTGRVLLVEDDDAVRILVARLLRTRGFEVAECDGPVEALALAERMAKEHRPPNLILSDVVMPHMDGLELIAALHAMLPGIPAVFMSGFADDVLELDDLARRGIGFVAKPFTTAELLATVRAAIAR